MAKSATNKRSAKINGSGQEGPVWAEIEVSPDRMSAVIRTLAPARSDGRALCVDDVIDALAEQFVVFGLHQEVLEEAVNRANATGEAQSNIKAATGLPVREGKDAYLEFRFTLNGEDPDEADRKRVQADWPETSIIKQAVRAGDVLAVVRPSQPSRAGMTVTGTELPTVQPRMGTKVPEAGENVILLEDGVTFVVAEGQAGYANYRQGKIFVENPVHISHDNRRAHITLHPPGLLSPSGADRPADLDFVMHVLECNGISRGIQEETLAGALRKVARMTEPLHGLLVARGRAPQNGEDGSIRYHFRTRELIGTCDEGTGQIDFKERRFLQNVKKGDLLAERTPLTSGWEGFDVLGATLPVAPGRDCKLQSTGKVKLSEDSLRCYADTDGVVTLSGEGKIGVFQLFRIPGDVDYSTGNLTMDGCLEIQGWVRAGFVVRASGDIFVKDGIENATVVSGANLEVKGGIIGKRQKTVRTGGSLQARFLDNALVDVAGDVSVQHSVMRSMIRAKGAVQVMGGKGCLIGGYVVADRGVVVNELGSRGAVKTLVEVGTNEEAMATFARYEKEVDFARRNERKVKRLLAALVKKGSAVSRAGVHTGDAGTRADGLDKLAAGAGKRPGGSDKLAAGAGKRAAEAGKQLAKVRALKARLVKLRRSTKQRRDMLSRCRKRVALAMNQGEDGNAGVTVKKAVFRGAKVTVNGYSLQVNEDIPKGGTFILDTESWIIRYLD